MFGFRRRKYRNGYAIGEIYGMNAAYQMVKKLRETQEGTGKEAIIEGLTDVQALRAVELVLTRQMEKKARNL